MSVKDYASESDPVWGLLSDEFKMLVDGELVASGQSSPIISPRNKEEVGRFAIADEEVIERTVNAAHRASKDPIWAKMSGRERGQRLLKMAEIIEQHADEFAFLDAIDVGKPVSTVHYSDIAVSLEALTYFAGRAQDLRGSSVDLGPDIYHRSRLEPQGVVLEVLPWNGPLWTGVQRLAAILAAGNAAIIKPAELASASFLHLAKLTADLFPAGVFNVVAGSGSKVGSALVKHPLVDMVSLTGGTETGARVLADTASQIKNVSLELGGKNPNIVLDDADLETAIAWSSMGAFANTGQVCVCGSRIYVQRAVYEAFAAGMVSAAEGQRVGDPLLADTQLGPLIGEDQFNKVSGYVREAIEQGQGELLTGGEGYEDSFRAGGWFFQPTVFKDVDTNCKIAREEIFGPVVTLTPFDEVDEAIEMANDTSYGLAAGVFTQDVARAGKIANELQSGQVYVNQWFSPGGMQAPSEGYKESGLGGVGIEKYLQVKNIFTKIN